MPAGARSHTPKGQLSRARILRAAEPLLSARGFHGTSMRDVAEAAGVPLASVVYHFPRKERLHAAMLGEIAAQILGALRRAGPAGAVRALVRWSLKNPGRVRLVVRELLDNPSRVAKARSFPLAPVLHTLAAAAPHPHPELAVLHVIGAISYVVLARPTVRAIVGPERDRELWASYEEHAIEFARRTFGLSVE
jgi:AcrR family transcriptional regulator